MPIGVASSLSMAPGMWAVALTYSVPSFLVYLVCYATITVDCPYDPTAH